MTGSRSPSTVVILSRLLWIVVASCGLGCTLLVDAADQAPAANVSAQQATWQEAMLAAREALAGIDAAFVPYVSGHMRREHASHKITVKVAGVEDLWLVVEGEDRHSQAGSAVWGDTRLVAKDGSSTPLSALKPSFLSPEKASYRFGLNERNKPLRVGERTYADGLWMAIGSMCFKLDRKYERLEAWIGIDASTGLRGNVRVRVLNHRDFTAWPGLAVGFPVACDWFLQDLVACGISISPETWDLRNYPARWFSNAAETDLEKRLITKVVDELGAGGQPIRARLQRLEQSHAQPHGREWLDLYVQACQLRRAVRLQAMTRLCPSLVFTKHANLGGSHYAYTEAQSDAQAERHFNPGSALCLLEMHDGEPQVRTLLEDSQGMIRDPDVSTDGQRILFAWKKSDRLDDFHLHELELASGRIRQLTFGLGFADYEGIYLPGGDILFNSTRCVQTVDCFTTEVSNLYTCDGQGRHLRRLSFDQVHTNFPTVTEDGRVLYTRWEYNDRGQIYPQALFQMNPDGTGQGEFYGNNSWFPTTILHARNICGTQKVLAIATGHHSRQVGKLMVLDPARGRQENEGAQLVAPVRETPAVQVDAFGQAGDLFQYPYPLSETEYLVTYAPFGWGGGSQPPETGWNGRPPFFGVYYMTIDSRRELLACDPRISCNQPIPLRRPASRGRPNMVNYAKETGTYYIQDVYAGPGLTGVARGTVKKLRVVALDFRAALLGGNGNAGVAGGAFVATPVAVGNGCWDPKIVLGETPVHEDGSVQFVVPARTPVYFQAIDQRGFVAQTMRSWSTLQPGENASCVGCHESKNSVPGPYGLSIAQRRPAQKLEPFYGPPRGFSFSKEIQPILDRHCVRCHNDRQKLAWIADKPSESPTAPVSRAKIEDTERAFSLLSEENVDPHAKRRWSDAYLSLTAARPDPRRGSFSGQSGPLVNWVSPQSAPPMLPPYSAGAATSGLMKLLADGHKNVHLSREEFEKIACWIDLVIPYCGDYLEAHTWSAEELARYDGFLTKRRQMEAIEAANIREYLSENHGSNGSRVATPVAALAAPQTDLIVEVQAADGALLARQAGKAGAVHPLVFNLSRRFAPGDKIRVQGAKHLAVQFDDRLGEIPIYAPKNEFAFTVPVAAPNVKPRSIPYPPEAWAANRPRITIRPLTLRELDAYRNLACNSYDVRGQSDAFPHASSNSECRNEAVFAARNAIDGFKENHRHGGWPYQSWGPEQRKDLWWQVDFGREVEIDKLVIVIRADFPHDKHWKRVTLVFSDGSRKPFELQKTASPLTVAFPAKRTTSVQLIDWDQDEPLGWCALTEVEVWGRDSIAIAADPEAVAKGDY